MTRAYMSMESPFNWVSRLTWDNIKARVGTCYYIHTSSGRLVRRVAPKAHALGLPLLGAATARHEGGAILHSSFDLRKNNHSTIILLLFVSALLPLVFNSAGVIAGFVLGGMVLGWLLLAPSERVRNKMVLQVVATLVFLMNGAFLIGVLTNGTWEI